MKANPPVPLLAPRFKCRVETKFLISVFKSKNNTWKQFGKFRNLFFGRKESMVGVTEVIYSKMLSQDLNCAIAQTIQYLGNWEQLHLF